ncbi:MAG: hypothetical protein WCX88_04470 [Patescibacteria group bacterium]|jgi:hypothetical protein
MYDRVEQWRAFSKQIELHIQQYTLKQYGNQAGNEQVDTFTVEDCFKNMERYFNRRKSMTRGAKEKLRDALKIAHYASFIYDKLKDELKEEDVYAPVADLRADCLFVDDMDANLSPEELAKVKVKVAAWYFNHFYGPPKKDNEDAK